MIILDLDNTLIYSSEFPMDHVKILLEYPPLTVHERPNARDLVSTCQQMGDITVFTTAVKDYAKNVCKELEINYTKLFSREDCGIANGMYVKYIAENWLENYNKIIVIDDSPEIWDSNARKNCTFLVPEKFTGNAHDDGLRKVIDDLNEIKSNS